MDKIKSFLRKTLEGETGKDIMVVIIVILVGLGSFGLGRLSKSTQLEGLKIEYMGQEANIISSIDLDTSKPILGQIDPVLSQIEGDKSFFGSSKGSKYYPLGCTAGKSLKLENRVYFKTAQEAESAGYELSSSCK